MLRNKIKAETFISLLVAISLFSTIYMVYMNWQKSYNKQRVDLFQQRQALFIADNQINLRMAKIPCEKQAVYNGTNFTIECSEHGVRVRFATGEVNIELDR